MKLFLYPYHPKSETAGLVAAELGIKRVKHKNSTVKDSKDLVIINWGSSTVPYKEAKIINKPEAVALAANKLNFFRAASGSNVRTPPFTTDRAEALTWITAGREVCVRQRLTANSGVGLTVVSSAEDVPDAPLYTQYVPKVGEFRVHVIDGGVVKVQQKVYPKDKDNSQVNWKIRTHDNGFIYQTCPPTEVPSQDILEQAKRAISLVGLDFGGVDVVWNQGRNRAYVLEINTAPGIEEHTLSVYAKHLKDLVNA